MTSLEEHFRRSEAAGEEALRSTVPFLKAAKALVQASKTGDMVKIRKAREDLAEASDQLKAASATAAGAWSLTPEEEEKLLQDQYEAEILLAARRHGLRVHQQEDYLVLSPSTVKVVPASRMVLLDKEKVRTLRPSYLVTLLKAHQNKKPRLSPEKFIETLYEAYHLVAEEGEGATLKRVYEALTIMPDVRKEYSSMDFAKDVFALDSKNVQYTKNGAKLSLPSATGTKSGKDVYSFVTADGEVVSYYGIRFEEPVGQGEPA